MSYIVPVHKPSGVRRAIKLNFINSDQENVIVAKANRLEIYGQTEEGLVLIHSRAIYGYITILDAFRPAASTTDHLFVGTDRYQYFTCSWDVENKILRTEQSYVDQADKVMRDSMNSDRCHIDPTGKFMTLELYDGVFSVVPFVQQSNKRQKRGSNASITTSNVGTLGEPVQVRTEETRVRDSAFLDVDADSKSHPRIAILWEDNSDTPQLKLRELRYNPNNDQSSVDLITVAELRAELDMGVSHLIPVSAPYGGLLVLGERSISYVDAELKNMQMEDLEDNATIWSCWTKVDDTRWLLADDYGRLFFIMIETDGSNVTSWKLDALGETSKASCLIYLDEGLVFIGSHSGDSQLVRIVPGSVEVHQTFSNIAPVLDFTIMDLGRGSEGAKGNEFSSGQARIVAACGAWQDGSIRSVRSGVGMEELGIIGEIPLINDMWGLSSSGLDDTHDILLATFWNETRVFKFDEEDSVEEIAEFANLELQEPTIYAANLPDRKLLQVYVTGVRLTDLDSGMSIFQWKPPDAESRLTSACANGAHLVAVEGGVTLHVFHTASQKAPFSKTFPSDSQISSVAIPNSQSNVCIVSFWQSSSVAVLDLHSLEVVSSISLDESARAVPRSLLVAQLAEDTLPTLFIAMADGTVITYSFDQSTNSLSNMTRILLGTEPVVFKSLPRPSDTGVELANVFASCEQPSLIYSSEGRMIYSAVNAEKSSRVAYFNTSSSPGAVAVATPAELKLARIGTERTTQLQTLPIGETTRCLTYEPHGKVFGMGCVRRLMESGTEALLSSVKLADEVSFKELDSVELRDNELVGCIASMTLDDEVADLPISLFIVGTSLMVDDPINGPDERGRIIVYKVDSARQKLSILTQVDLKGACRSLAICDGMIVAGLVKVVALYTLIPSRQRSDRYTHELVRLASYRTSSNPESISVQPSTDSSPASIAVADLTRSLSILHVLTPGDSSTDDWQLKEVGRHYAVVWSSTTAAVGENEWILADMEGNLGMFRRNKEAVTREQQLRLEFTGEMRLGEQVNKIIPFASSAPTATMESAGKGKQRSRTMSSALASDDLQKGIAQLRTGPLIQPQAFLATVEGAIYLLGAISPPYVDALLRLQSALATRVQAPGYMPWTRYRAWRTEVREADEPFRFVDGEMVESGLLSLSHTELETLLKEHGLTDRTEEGGLELTVSEVKAWAEELRRLY